MQDNPANVISMGEQSRARTGLVRFTALAFVLLIVGLIVWRIWSTQRSAPALSGAETLSASAFEARHGLRVRLIGVTAGGGMVDFRLKITDPEKARAFLQDPAHLPRLVVAGSGEALPGTEELEDDVTWEEGGILFIMFSNIGAVIKPGTSVIVSFGEVQLEPVPAQ